MQQEVDALFGYLAGNRTNITIAQRKSIAKTAHTLVHAWDQLNSAAQSGLISALSQLTETPFPIPASMAHSMLYSITEEEVYLKRAVEALSKIEGDLSLYNATLTSINGLLFDKASNTEKIISRYFTRDFLKEIFRKSVRCIDHLYTQLMPEMALAPEQNNRVVILAKQLLRPPHAPSLDAFNFARTLIKEHGKEVLIVVTWELACDFDGAWVPCSHFNKDDNFFGANSISYLDTQIPFFMASNGEFDETAAGRSIAAIAQFNPEMILSISAPSLIAEAFRNDKFCFIYPTGIGKDIPLTAGCYFHTWDQPDTNGLQCLKDEDLEEKFLFAKHPGFEIKQPSNSLTRQEFEIPQEAFVFATIGLRLQKDIDASFIQLLEKIAVDDRVIFVFAGVFEDFDKSIGSHPTLAAKSKFLGLQKDIMAVYNICDAVLNPTRQGGGSSAVYALQAALPVLSLRFGDTGIATEAFPEITNYDAMATTALQLVADRETYDTYTEIARREAQKFSGQSSFIARIMEEFEKYKGNRLVTIK